MNALKLNLLALGTDQNGIYLKQSVPIKHVSRHSDAGWNPEKRPLLVDMDPGLRREDGAFWLNVSAILVCPQLCHSYVCGYEDISIQFLPLALAL